MENIKTILNLISQDMYALYAIWIGIGLAALPVLFWVERKL